MRPILFCDTETDGIRPDRRIWEIALILREPTGEEYLTLIIDDVDMSKAEPEALAVNHFEERFHRELLPHERRVREFQAAQILHEWTTDATIVGAQPWFDTHGITNLLARHGLEPRWHYRQKCVESLGAGYVRLDTGGLVTTAQACGVPVDLQAVHTAMGDALLARGIWDVVMTGEARPAEI